MSRRAQENLIAVLILCVFIAVIVASTGYGPRARLVPIPIAGLGAILILAQLILQNFRSEKDLEIDLLDFISRKSTGDHDPVTPNLAQSGSDAAATGQPSAVWKREFAALGIVVLIVAMFLVIGPLPTMFFFTAGYFIVSRYASPAMGLLYAFGATAAVYLLFHAWLGVKMRAGLIDLGFGLW